jgi:hypothetical protein
MNDQAHKVITYLPSIPEITALVKDADSNGLTSIESADRPESFQTKMFAYRPAFIRLLYRLRAHLVRLLGFRQVVLPAMEERIPDDFPMQPSGIVWFFTVQRVENDCFWNSGYPRDRHLDADLSVVAQPMDKRCRRFNVFTVVRYKHWTGPVYFNRFLINRMVHAAVGHGPAFPMVDLLR